MVGGIKELGYFIYRNQHMLSLASNIFYACNEIQITKSVKFISILLTLKHLVKVISWMTQH